MNKFFFKIENKIKLTDILITLNVSEEEFLNVNENVNINTENYFIIDLVSFSDLTVNKLSFYTNQKNNCKNVISGVCIVKIENINSLNEEIIKIPSKNPKGDFSIILKKYFGNFFLKNFSHSIHPSALIHKTAKIGNNVSIGAYSCIGEEVVIEDDTFISERVSIAYKCKIGKKCFFGVGAVVECSIIEDNVNISSNTVVGKVGFGFIPNKSKTYLTPHIGAVFIGKGTNIGAGCTIDRGLIDDTYIGKYVMIDNQVHIGHNSTIEDFCILAGQVGLSGSVSLKKMLLLVEMLVSKIILLLVKIQLLQVLQKYSTAFLKVAILVGAPLRIYMLGKEWLHLKD